ncbi:MAG: PDZ domain-containing protein [Actinomycetota bacterium]|nr:PDZ domain-containing protein [Actinomycetota bacterium]
MDAPPSPTARKTHRRFFSVLIVALVIVAILAVGTVVAVVRGAKGYYALSPGTAPTLTDSASCRARNVGDVELVLPGGTPCARLIVPPNHAHPVNGKLFMVDVLVGPAPPWQYFLDKVGLLHHFSDGTQLVPANEILGNVPSAQLGCQDSRQMDTSTQGAVVVALRRLGYQVGESDQGARLDVVQPGTPAATAGLQCNDIVTNIGTSPVHTAQDLVNVIHQHRPGDSVEITVKRAGAARTVIAKLTGTPAIAGKPVAPSTAFLGVTSEPVVNFQLPFDVSINVGGIGGPSAGLSLTLGLLDLLSNGQLTGGHKVAATGTINLDGSVGDVGGVAQKTVAVRKAGAELFLVPKDELKDAQSEAGPRLKVIPVTSLDDALHALQALGGQVPPAPAS